MGWNNCKNAKTCGHSICFEKACKKYEPKETTPMTNADRIRAMSDAELASFIVDWDCHMCAEHKRLDNEPLLRGERCDEQCEKHLIEWLRQPTEV